MCIRDREQQEYQGEEQRIEEEGIKKEKNKKIEKNKKLCCVSSFFSLRPVVTSLLLGYHCINSNTRRN